MSVPELTAYQPWSVCLREKPLNDHRASCSIPYSYPIASGAKFENLRLSRIYRSEYPSTSVAALGLGSLYMPFLGDLRAFQPPAE